MDAHYMQVMRERETLGDAPARPYFAYSTILDRHAFETWRTQHGYDFFDLPAGTVAEAQDVSLAYDFASRWWGGRVAGLVDAPGRSVWGVLFRIPGVDWPVVRHKEGAVTAMCVERPVSVALPDGTRIEATAFATNPARRRFDGPVSHAFVDALVQGARSANLPSAWIEALATEPR